MPSSEKLFINLEKTYALHLEMKKLAEQKRNALILGNLSELSKIGQKETLWIKEIKDLEEKRIDIINNFLKDEDNIAQDITFMNLINSEYISKIEQIKLKEIYNKLVNLFAEIRKENELNTELIKQSIDFVSNSLKTITDEPAQTSTYSKPTNKNRELSTSTRIFDKKV